MFASAIASAIAVAAFALFLQGKIETIAAARTKETAALNKDNSAAQVHAIAQITAPQRASLEVVLKPDVLSIVNTLTDTGKDAGVDLQVSNAVPETIATQKGATTALHAVGFTLSGVGTFSNLMTAAALLEKLPIASSIERIICSTWRLIHKRIARPPGI